MEESKTAQKNQVKEDVSTERRASDWSQHSGNESWFKNRLNFVRSELRKDNPMKLQRDIKFK